MNNDFILNPNCSELVFRIVDDMSEELLMKELEKIGIFPVVTHDKYKKISFLDMDNPNLPDFTNGGEICYGILDDDNVLYGFQHHQEHIYPTMYKIEEYILGEWLGHDGGSPLSYEEWKEEGKYKEKIKDIQTAENRKKREKLLKELHFRNGKNLYPLGES